MSDKPEPDPHTLAQVAADFVWAVCEVGRPCVELHTHDDHCAGEFPYPGPGAFDSMYGVAEYIDGQVGLDNTVWRVHASHMWEVDYLNNDRVEARFFVNYLPIARTRPEGFVVGEANGRLTVYRHES